MRSKNFDVIFFTDGACSGNPGPGGWAFIALINDQVEEKGGFDNKTTNNQMELKAAIEALKYLNRKDAPKERLRVQVNTDSKYLIDGASKWLSNWKKKSWLKADGAAVMNLDYWKELDSLLELLSGRMSLDWNYVPAHSGIPANERVDGIAVSYSKNEVPNLYLGNADSYEYDLSIVSKSSDNPAKFPSYLSLVEGVLNEDRSWAECESRTKGKKGARFKKIKSQTEKNEVLKKWGLV